MIEDNYSAADATALDITALMQLRDMMEDDFIEVIEAYLVDTPERLPRRPPASLSRRL